MSFSETISSSCKINLRLKVTRKRSDGYHELDTIFVPLPFPADNIVIKEQEESGVSFFSPEFPDLPAENNLAVKAALSYASAAGISPRWHIELEKSVPVAAGLGGGSADAAAVLRLLDRRYRALPEEKLAELAVKLGADVPFFLKNRPMRARGIGEELENFVLPENMPEILIVFPGFPISARWAYQALAKDIILIIASTWENTFCTHSTFGEVMREINNTTFNRFARSRVGYDTIYGSIYMQIGLAGLIQYRHHHYGQQVDTLFHN